MTVAKSPVSCLILPVPRIAGTSSIIIGTTQRNKPGKNPGERVDVSVPVTVRADGTQVIVLRGVNGGQAEGLKRIIDEESGGQGERGVSFFTKVVERARAELRIANIHPADKKITEGMVEMAALEGGIGVYGNLPPRKVPERRGETERTLSQRELASLPEGAKSDRSSGRRMADLYLRNLIKNEEEILEPLIEAAAVNPHTALALVNAATNPNYPPSQEDRRTTLCERAKSLNIDFFFQQFNSTRNPEYFKALSALATRVINPNAQEALRIMDIGLLEGSSDLIQDLEVCARFKNKPALERLIAASCGRNDQATEALYSLSWRQNEARQGLRKAAQDPRNIMAREDYARIRKTYEDEILAEGPYEWPVFENLSPDNRAEIAGIVGATLGDLCTAIGMGLHLAGDGKILKTALKFGMLSSSRKSDPESLRLVLGGLVEALNMKEMRKIYVRVCKAEKLEA